MANPITLKNGRLDVPDDPIIPFIEGDGTGPDIWRASVRVLDAAVTITVTSACRNLSDIVRLPQLQ